MTEYHSHRPGHTPTANAPVTGLARPVSRALLIVAAAVLLFIALVVSWLGQASSHIYTQGANALVIRAVLRMDADAVATEELAQLVRREIPDAEIEIIDEAMGRSLMALQEPWIAEMPDFEVTPLPTLVEIRHPRLLTAPAQVTKLIERLNDAPPVDFVAYNETAHDRLVKLAQSTEQIENHVLRWVLLALAVGGFALAAGIFCFAPNHSMLAAATTIAIIWLAAWAGGWLIYRGWETTAISTGTWQRLEPATHIKMGIAALVILIIAAAAARAIRWVRP